jgi:hypothetical protein
VQVNKEREEVNKKRMRGWRWSKCTRTRNEDIGKYIRQITEVSMGWHNHCLQIVLKYVPFLFPPNYMSSIVFKS